MNILNPTVYSDDEIEEDISKLKQDKADIKSKIHEHNDMYDDKLREARDAPEHLVEDLLFDAEDIVQTKKHIENKYEAIDDQLRLLKSVRSFRRRIWKSDQEWNLNDLNNLAGNEYLQSELREALENHMRTE